MQNIEMAYLSREPKSNALFFFLAFRLNVTSNFSG